MKYIKRLKLLYYNKKLKLLRKQMKQTKDPNKISKFMNKSFKLAKKIKVLN